MRLKKAVYCHVERLRQLYCPRSKLVSSQTTFDVGPRAAIKVSARLQCILSLIGFTSVIAQIVLMRELIVVFYGNEISLGIMLAGWLLWTAIAQAYQVRFPRVCAIHGS